ncbi:MAG: glycosyltransferase [Promethearchaeota archaeon]
MKILHFSDVGLPDTRVERAALYSKMKGWDVVFAGGRPPQNQIFGVFEKVYYRHWGPYEKTGFFGTLHKIRDWLRWLIREEEPDLIHAHDLFAAKVALDVGHPFVYDDHEIWGSRITYQGSDVIKRNRTITRRLATRFAFYNWRKWDAQLIQSSPIITVSKQFAQLYRRKNQLVYVIPNVPTQQEVELIPPNENIDDEFRIAIVSRDQLPLNQRPDKKTLELWLQNRFGASLVFIGYPVIHTEEVINVGYVTHQKMLQVFSTCDAALLGKWTRRPVYSIQNRFSLFLHAGLKSIVPTTKPTEVEFCKEHDVGWSWASIGELKTRIQQLTRNYFADVDSWNKEKLRVRKVAQRFLLWSHYGGQLEQAYKAAQSKR